MAVTVFYAYDLPKFACNWLLSAESGLWLFDFTAITDQMSSPHMIIPVTDNMLFLP